MIESDKERMEWKTAKEVQERKKGKEEVNQRRLNKMTERGEIERETDIMSQTECVRKRRGEMCVQYVVQKERDVKDIQ